MSSFSRALPVLTFTSYISSSVLCCLHMSHTEELTIKRGLFFFFKKRKKNLTSGSVCSYCHACQHNQKLICALWWVYTTGVSLACRSVITLWVRGRCSSHCGTLGVAGAETNVKRASCAVGAWRRGSDVERQNGSRSKRQPTSQNSGGAFLKTHFGISSQRREEVVVMEGWLAVTLVSIAMFVGCFLLGFIPLLFRLSEVSAPPDGDAVLLATPMGNFSRQSLLSVTIHCAVWAEPSLRSWRGLAFTDGQ